MAATAFDLALLLAALIWATVMGVSIGAPGEVDWLLLVWAVLVCPFYFALYHSYGTGATPGQRELGVAVRGVAGNTRMGLASALLRAYSAPLLFVPAAHDRVTRSRVLELRTAAEAPPAWLPTSLELIEIFEPTLPGHALRRAFRLLRSHRRQLVRAVLVVYLGLVALAAVIAPLFLEDFRGTSQTGRFEAVVWAVIAILLFASGVFWKQAVVSTAVEAIRTGQRIGIGETLRRTARHANGLTVALLLLIVAVSVGQVVVWMTLGLGLVVLLHVLARFIFVIPAIVLEERHVLAAFRRSGRLTRRQPWRLAGKLFVSALATLLLLYVVGSISVGMALGFASPSSTIGYAYVVALGLAVASIPVSWALALIGTVWVLLFHDLRCAERAPR